MSFYRYPRTRRLTLQAQVLAALFQGVTPRTAGFSTVGCSDVSEPTLLTQIPLVFVGVAPASTGGGSQGDGAPARLPARRLAGAGRWETGRIRTSRPEPLPPQDPALVSVAALLVVLGAVAILISDGWEFLLALFHSTSALGTVGLSVRSSAELGAFGKLLLILLFMFVGRLGPIAFLVTSSSRCRSDDYPPGNTAVG